MTSPQATRPPLVRPREGRVLGGVCAGLARHLDVPVGAVRVMMAASVLVAGAGVVGYLWLLLTVPAADGDGAARPTRLTRLVPALRVGRSEGRALGDVGIGLGLIAIALVLIAVREDFLNSPWLLAVVVILGGAALTWSQLADVDRTRAAGRPVERGPVILRVAGGTAVAVVGIVLLVGQGQTMTQVVRGAVAGAAILAGVVIVLAPLGLRVWHQLTQERTARAREAERADIAAHLHDSVLQTLSLIRSRAQDPAAVTQLARAQERQLREWLYADRAEPGDSLAAEVAAVAAEVEDLHAVPVDVVTVGDRRPDAGTAALAAATREALTNAVVHGRAPVSLFVEVRPEAAEVFVRDRGAGFDLDAVPADRHGVRESILARMHRHGGTAQIRTGGARGTEVELRMPAPTPVSPATNSPATNSPATNGTSR